jgi:hypothetical protein
MSVVYFPVARRIDGLVWHGGRGFKTTKALIDSRSDTDWRRVVDWERRNAAWLASQRPHDGDKQQGGAA